MKKIILFIALIFSTGAIFAQNTNTRNSSVNISNINKTKKTITTVHRGPVGKVEPANPVFVNTLDVPIYIFANPKHKKIGMVDEILLPGAQLPVNSKSIDTIVVKRGKNILRVPKICFSVGLSPDGSDAKSYAAKYTNGHVYLVKDKSAFHRNDGSAYEVPLTNYYQLNKGVFTIKNSTDFSSLMLVDKGFSFSGVTLANQQSATVTNADLSKMRASTTGIYPLNVLFIKAVGDAPIKATIYLALPEKGGTVEITAEHFKISNKEDKTVRMTIKNLTGLTTVIVCGDEEIVFQPRNAKCLKPNYGQNDLIIKWFDNGWHHSILSFIAGNINCADLVYYKGQFALKQRQ